MGQFTNSRDLYFGEGARHEVKNLKVKKAIICTGGGSMRRGGFLQDIEATSKRPVSRSRFSRASSPTPPSRRS